MTNDIGKIADNSAYTQIAAQGGETVLDYTFPLYDEKYLKIVKTDAEGGESVLELGADYSVQGVGGEGGGTATLVNPAAEGEIYTLLLNVAPERETDFQQAGDFFASDLNRELDLITQRDQQFRRDGGNVLRMPEADVSDPSLSVLPTKQKRAGKVLEFDGEGKIVTDTDAAPLHDVESYVETAVAAAAQSAASSESAYNSAAHADTVSGNIDGMAVSFKHRLTGVRIESMEGSAITLGGDGLLHIPAMTVLFNKKVFFGDAVGDFASVEFPEQTFACQPLTGTSGKVFFLVANIGGTISMQEDALAASDGASKCLLGSGFALYDAESGWSFQPGSWAYMPWLPITGADARQSGSVVLSHALIKSNSDKTVALEDFKALAEGINASNPAMPSLKDFGGSDPWAFKYLYPGYSALESMRSDIDGRAVYDLDTGTLQESDVEGKYAVYVPFVTPTGQGIILPPQGTYAAGRWSCHFDNVEAALQALSGMTYDLTGLSSRLIPLGISFVVRTNNPGPNTSAENFLTASSIPNQFATQNAAQIGFNGYSNLPYPPGYLKGFELMADVDGNLVAGAGNARSADNSANIVLSGAMTKTLATWSAGNGGGCVPAALLPLVADTKYYVISLLNSTGAVDFAIDDNEAGTNALADPAVIAWGGGSLKLRAIGFFITTAALGVGTPVSYSQGADRALSNVDAAGKAAVARMGMPSDTSIAISLSGLATIYTAPADGYIYFTKTHSGSTSGNATVGVYREGAQPPYNESNLLNMSEIYGFNNGQVLAITHPVRKGQIVGIYYSYASAVSAAFIPAQGEE